MLCPGTMIVGTIVAPSVAITVKEGAMVVTRREALAAAVAGGLALTGAAEDKPPEKPPHVVEKTDMKGRMASGLPSGATEDGAVVVKSFFAKMTTYPDIRFREFFDPRYLKKH